ncbi:unnamed protein product [Adineta steineri]|uniref:Uncharacterized protein n=1 Tax=Adineta steineri TaxID=433720 RepID=A0A818R5A3_9BILA|nr:unnamed protein product [Adineta steineri]CAF0926263.1 unnamed protein product [Adineta steineri]CAF1231292.1 unnamed protein product [Adineta steineri]CAF3509416.1 unnamed protein product [Adineta steineri]CAF3652008.1 unnamed protein product [Adineta steineri]
MASQDVSSKNILTVNEADNEKFEEVDVDGGTLLLDNGRRCESAKHRIPGFAQGSGSYSSGIHHIRFKILRGFLFVGIRSRNLPVQVDFSGEDTQYIDNSCTCGWFSKGPNVVHGESKLTHLKGYANANGIYVLTLNCDERRLSIMFPNGPQHDEMDVDLLRTPFPWRFCVQLSRLGGCLSLE